MHAGCGGDVVAETGSATVVSNDLELLLLPPGNHAGPDGSCGPGGSGDRDRAASRVSSQGRRGTGERLVYSSETERIRADRNGGESSHG